MRVSDNMKADELDICTGKIEYDEKDYNFVFDKKILRLVPREPNLKEMMENFLKPECVTSPYLKGKCNETGEDFIFFPKGKNIGRCNSVLFIELVAYIIKDPNYDIVDRISFISDEINCIFPNRQALEKTSYSEDGSILIKTKKFDETTSNEETFNVNGNEVNVEFDIVRTISNKIENPPLVLNSSMTFEFEPISDFLFVIRLVKIANNFIQYLCYRRNCYIPTVKLAAPKDGKHIEFGIMHIINKQEKESEIEALEKGCYIKQEYIAGHEGQILEDIENKMLYLRHIPKSYYAGNTIDEARFVMITAAFEWEFNRTHKDGIRRKQASIKAESDVTNKINELINSTKGKKKDIYKRLLNSIKVDNLQSKVIQMGKEYSDVMKIFSDNLYGLNDETLEYSEMGAELATQRNNYAHGNLDKEFVGKSLLHLIFLERVVYAIQLKKYGIEDNIIKKALNDLFNLNLDLE